MEKKCDVCHTTYSRSHTCRGGECPDCHRTFRFSLETHSCVVRNLEKLETLPLEPAPWHCDACMRGHYSSSTMSPYKKVLLCKFCYEIPQIKQEQILLGRTVRLYMVSQNKVDCKLCNIKLLDTQGNEVYPSQLDHYSVFDKIESVGTMILQGYPIKTILQEVDKCRALCIPCHSVVTHVEQRSGICRAKDQLFSKDEQDNFIMRIDKRVQRILVANQNDRCSDV